MKNRMSEITHDDIARFATERINLPAEIAQKHRRQVNLLRERLEAKIAEDPAFDLVKRLHAGSVAKGTALRTVNDLDVAVYVKAGDAPKADGELNSWLAKRLAEANPTMKPEQFEPQTHCVTINFRNTGLKVDMVPVLYEGAADDCGWLVRKRTGERVLTSIPLHLQFMRDRKRRYGDDCNQLIRILKWWKREKGLRFKSFMIELLWARLAATGVSLADYPTVLEDFFAYIVKSGMKERIFFTEHYLRGGYLLTILASSRSLTRSIQTITLQKITKRPTAGLSSQRRMMLLTPLVRPGMPQPKLKLLNAGRIS